MIWFAELATSLGLSELQLSLGLIGFVLLILVMIYNAMRIRKVEQEDHVVDSIEPPLESAHNDHNQRAEPTLAIQEEVVTPPINQLIGKIDPLIDCVGVLRLPEAISGSEILGHLNEWPKYNSFTCLFEGLNTNSNWEGINSNNTYTELQIAIQLANRTGPIGVVDLSDFVSKVQVLANALDAEVDLPPTAETIEAAKVLDQFAAQSDIQLGVTVIPKESHWNLATIQNVATKAGLILSRDGREYQRVIQHQVIYKLVADQANFLRDDSSKASIGMVTLLLDLPRVPQETQPFQLMLDDAKLLAESLNGHLVDDAGRPLVDEAVSTIVSQLEQIYQSMNQQGIPAGSATASRLFS